VRTEEDGFFFSYFRIFNQKYTQRQGNLENRRM